MDYAAGPLDMVKQESMETHFNDITLPLSLDRQGSTDSIQLQNMNYLDSRRSSSDDLELELEIVQEVSAAPVSLEPEMMTDNVIIANVREVALTHVPEVSLEGDVTPAFVQDNEVSLNSSSDSSAEYSTARRYYNQHKRSMINSRFEMSMNNRKRKTDEQVDVLLAIFDKHDGKPSKEMKEEAMSKTGLAWIQIYKWYFDHKVKKEKHMRAYSTDYPFAIFKVEGPDGREKPRPLFYTEKVVRSA